MDLSRAQWRKARLSNSNGGDCVEVARRLPGAVAVRDSKHPQEPAVLTTPRAWRAFTASLRG